MKAEFRELAARPDWLLFHDDLAQPNDPVHFHEFVAHARRHGLGFVAEAELWSMATGDLGPRVRQYLAGLEPLDREQYLDFARLRRIRHSLLCRADDRTRFTLRPERIAAMRVGAPTALVRAAAEGRLATSASGEDGALLALLRALVAAAPRTLAFAEAADVLRLHGARSRPVEHVLAAAAMAGNLDLALVAAAVAATPGATPRAFAVARWQASRMETLTSLRHETVRVADANARHLLSLADGTRTRDKLAASLRPALDGVDAAAFVDDWLQLFARQSLLLAST
jgi:hypothetical protein